MILVVLVVAAGAIVWLVRRGRPLEASAWQKSAAPAPAPSAPPARATVAISVLYGTEKKQWLEASAAEFVKARPEVQVQLIGKGSLESAQALLEGKTKPVLWSPADSCVLAMLQSDWRLKYGADPFVGGEAPPAPLVLTPLVFVVWEDRSEALLKQGRGHVTWKAIHAAVRSNQGWPAIGGKSEWGFVKLGHTDPTLSNSGMQALLLMTFEYYEKTSALTVANLLDPKYQTFVAETERGVSNFETSTGTFMNDMIRFGPSKYDVAVVYESLAISQLENAQGRWGNLRVYYPAVTMWSDNPIAIMKGDWVTPEQERAARAFVAFLRSKRSQERALDYGFRPTDPSIPIRSSDGSNPFNRLARHGIALDLPPAATVPDGIVLRNLLTMWSRVVGKR